LTVQTTGGTPIEQFAIELAEKWKLGQKGKDNGMLFVIAVADRRYRFEVGYGLEGFITDQYCGRVGREVLAPLIKQGNYSKGIHQANLEVVRKIATEAGVTLTGMPKLRPAPVARPVRRGLPCCSILPVLIFMLLLFGGLGRGMGWWIRRIWRLRQERLIRRRQLRRRVRRIRRRHGRWIRRRRRQRKLVEINNTHGVA
jgi:uncharacterized protein